ncbi:MAG: hypothetical protein NUV73_01020 [Candidatus Daviesbacteria bacterium]|nr:hypothetical protein [Candidatus Daviesbacteria bacterium]
MPSPEEREIVISAGAIGTPDKIFRTPEALGQGGIHIHRRVVEDMWGPEAVVAYIQALAQRNNKAMEGIHTSTRIHPCAPRDYKGKVAEDGWPQNIKGDGFPIVKEIS